MKVSKNSLLAVLLVTCSLALAQGVAAATDKTESPKKAGAVGMGPGMATMPMHEQLQRMQKQMDEATVPEERRKLMTEHMESMQRMMQMMHGMMAGQGMMNPPCAEGVGGDRMARMEQRMNMMQMMMMDQMLKAQSEQLDKE